MLQKVQLPGVEFPTLYIAENKDDTRKAQLNGIPYIRWGKGMDLFIRSLLRPTLEKMFPGIAWSKVLGRKKDVASCVVWCPGVEDDGEDRETAGYSADEMLEEQLAHTPTAPDPVEEDAYFERDVPIATEDRCIPADNSYLGYDWFEGEKLSVYDYIGDTMSSVNIDALQQLRLLPKFVGDITDCIKRNLSNRVYWTEGYNKKLGYPLGNFDASVDLPNLIILDISASIPDGIAATMLTLIDTLREQTNADLIITSARSGFYKSGCQLPDVQTLREYYGRSNEGAEFMAILEKYVAGREFGHVISFGDNDNPGSAMSWHSGSGSFAPKLSNVKVHEVHHFHTWKKRYRTGYARWVNDVCPNVIEHYDTSWCDVMDNGYRF